MDFQDGLVIVGAVAITAGLTLIAIPLGLIGGGTSLIILAYLVKGSA
jgi:hypothetical protein